MQEPIQTALDFFTKHYKVRMDGQDPAPSNINLVVNGPMICLDHPRWRLNNGPRIFHHDKRTEDVIVLTHGYTDSPYYVQDIARRFHEAGLNVVMPLLPAHGLREPGSALEDDTLDQQWRDAIDHAVETAARLGDRISVGGLSTGGALSLNKILRDEDDRINGGLFLFSAAIDIGDFNESASKLGFLQSIIKVIEGPIRGEGQDPYKYPEMSQSGGMEVGQIVNDNNARLKQDNYNRTIKTPVFAAHSAHDKTASLAGLIDFMTHHVEQGVTMVITQNTRRRTVKVGETDIIRDHLEHGCLTLAEDIVLDDAFADPPDYLPLANPKFEWMMEGTLRFFAEAVRGRSAD